MMFATESQEQANGAAKAQPWYGARGEDSHTTCALGAALGRRLYVTCNPLLNGEVRYWCATAVLQALQGQAMPWTGALHHVRREA